MKLTNQINKLVELGFVYALTNPDTDEIFYIGVTESAPKDRLKGHYIHYSEYLKGIRNKTKKFEYFDSIWPKLANVKLLKIVQNDYLYKIEQDYIKEYSQKYNLTNQTIGGEGEDTFSLQEMIDKMRISELRSCNLNKKISDEQKQFLSETRKGSLNPMAGKGLTGSIVIFNECDKNNPIKLCNYPFEITSFLDEQFPEEEHKLHSGRVANITKACRKNQSRECKSSGFFFKQLETCSKEIQDIVHEKFEKIS